MPIGEPNFNETRWQCGCSAGSMRRIADDHAPRRQLHCWRSAPGRMGAWRRFAEQLDRSRFVRGRLHEPVQCNASRWTECRLLHPQCRQRLHTSIPAAPRYICSTCNNGCGAPTEVASTGSSGGSGSPEAVTTIRAYVPAATPNRELHFHSFDKRKGHKPAPFFPTRQPTAHAYRYSYK
jgi:hypothetical protein